MLKFTLLSAALLLPGLAAFHRAADTPRASRVPVLLELFTSEGCSSCPPADRLLETMDQTQPVPNADLIVLSEHVDYWNSPAWRDPYSSAQFSDRQNNYATKLGNEVYTPQLVIDGRFALVGSNANQAFSAVQKATASPKLPLTLSQISQDGNHISGRIQLPPSGHGSALLVVALADNRDESQVVGGENAHRKLSHVAVTRLLQPLGKVSLDTPVDRNFTLTSPVKIAPNSRLVAFLTDPKTGYVLAVAVQKAVT